MTEWKIFIQAMQETQTKHIGITKVNDICEIHILKNKVFVKEDMKDNTTNFKAQAHIVCQLQIRGKNNKTNMLNVHAPTVEKDREERMHFTSI